MVSRRVEDARAVRCGCRRGEGIGRLRDLENVLAQSADWSRAASSGDELMDLETLRELQRRGRFFHEMFPGAKASEEWQRHRDQMEREEEYSPRSSPPAPGGQTDESSDSE
jgi:hypothetical protein